jgi:hypothetical protein
MPGSFDAQLKIVHGCLKPGGPLGLAGGETVLRLDFWIRQDDGAACMGFLPGPEGQMNQIPPGRWRMTQDPMHFGAEFHLGAAIGSGLMVKENAQGQVIVEQWKTDINLV